MRLILSRKGFDSSAGGVANPIMPDGRLAILPIPMRGEPHAYGSVTVAGEPAHVLVESLTRERITRHHQCHLDPDLDAHATNRPFGFRAAFGQSDAAATHLAAQGVDVGDIFLFFGWFRQTEYVEGRVLRYAANAPNRHVIYGWLQVGEIIRGVSSKDEILSRFPQIEQHPHLRPERLAVASNTIFLGASGLVLAGRPLGRPGAGLFRSMDDGLVLTDEASPNRALWRLPEFMHPARGSRLSYHEKESRWSEAAGIVRLKSVGRGQEFVLTPGSQADMNSWLEALFEGAVQGRTA